MSTPSKTSYVAGTNTTAYMTATWQSGSTWEIKYSSNLNSSGDESNGTVLIRVPDISNAGPSPTHVSIIGDSGGNFTALASHNMVQISGDDDNQSVRILYTFDSSFGLIEGVAEGNGNGTSVDNMTATHPNYCAINITDTGYATASVTHTITVKGMDANHNVLATDTYTFGAGSPTIAVGDMVGVVVSIDHQDRNDDEDSDCYTQSVFFNDFDTLGMGSKISGLPPGNYVLPYLNHPTAYWYYSASNVWNGVGEVGDCVGDNNANLEHTATMDGVTYKIRYRQILNSSVPSGLSLDVSDSQVNQVTSSTSDQYHSFLSAAYMQAFRRTADSSRNYNYIEAYIHSVS